MALQAPAAVVAIPGRAGSKGASASKLVIMNPGKAAAFVNPMIFSDADIVVPVFNRG